MALEALQLAKANFVFGSYVKYKEPITYREVKEDDHFYMLCRRLNFSHYSIALGSSLFQRLLYTSNRLSQLVSLESDYYKQFISYDYSNITMESLDSPTTPLIVFLKDLYISMGCSRLTLLYIPHLLLMSCCSIAAKFHDHSSTIPHNVSQFMLKELLRNKETATQLAVHLEFIILQQLDWGINPLTIGFLPECNDMPATPVPAACVHIKTKTAATQTDKDSSNALNCCESLDV